MDLDLSHPQIAGTKSKTGRCSSKISEVPWKDVLTFRGVLHRYMYVNSDVFDKHKEKHLCRHNNLLLDSK